MIPVSQPWIGERETELVLQALHEGEISGSSGHFIQEFEERFAAYCGCEFGIATNSGSTALHLATTVAGIRPSDEVLVSSCTNIASAIAVVSQGGRVIPVDSEFDTWNMNTRLLEDLVTPRTRAIMPVHIYGHPVDMNEVLQVAEKYDLIVIEDCAEAHGAEYRGQRVGGLGHLGCLSFYANKIITTGEGGMIVTNDSHLAERARLLRNLGFTIPRFFHEELGFNYRMTNLQAAIGVAQMERINEVIKRKRTIASWYSERLRDLPGIQLPVEKDYAKNVYWMYAIVTDDRNTLMQELKDQNIETRTMFCPLNLQPALLNRKAVRDAPCPVAESLWQHGMYLPSGSQLTEVQIDKICGVISGVLACA